MTIVLYAKRSMRKCQKPKEMKLDVLAVDFCIKVTFMAYVRKIK